MQVVARGKIEGRAAPAEIRGRNGHRYSIDLDGDPGGGGHGPCADGPGRILRCHRIGSGCLLAARSQEEKQGQYWYRQFHLRRFCPIKLQLSQILAC